MNNEMFCYIGKTKTKNETIISTDYQILCFSFLAEPVETQQK